MTLQPETPEGIAFRVATLEGRVRSLEQRMAQQEQAAQLLDVLATPPWKRLWFVLDGWHPYRLDTRWHPGLGVLVRRLFP